MFFGMYADDIDQVVDALEESHHRQPIGPAAEEVRATKRLYFLVLSALLVLWTTFIIAFCVIKISTPFWMESQMLPFHVVWPYQLHDPSKHFISHVIIYFFQGTTLAYLLIWLCFEENMTVSIFFEMASALRVLCIELRSLQEYCKGNEILLARELRRLTRFHQRII